MTSGQYSFYLLLNADWLIQISEGLAVCKVVSVDSAVVSVNICSVEGRGGWQRGLDPRFYDCTRKEIRPSETKYSLVENKMADGPSKVVVENLSRSSSVKS